LSRQAGAGGVMYGHGVRPHVRARRPRDVRVRVRCAGDVRVRGAYGGCARGVRLAVRWVDVPRTVQHAGGCLDLRGRRRRAWGQCDRRCGWYGRADGPGCGAPGDEGERRARMGAMPAEGKVIPWHRCLLLALPGWAVARLVVIST